MLPLFSKLVIQEIKATHTIKSKYPMQDDHHNIYSTTDYVISFKHLNNTTVIKYIIIEI